ncbi:MAG TPA: cation diffusion facilitator family transporter [Solirubrobacteraceae bacterium]|nr:cation diffusion facilitator family transporter [Solirubrobacteraceae bacterium]
MAASDNNSAVKTKAASVAIVSNSCLIAIKLAAGILTGSVGILSDAIHSMMDLVASVISLLSVRKADVPADASHRYGHEKLEDLSAGAQAILLLIGAAFVAYEAVHRLVAGGAITSIGIGIIVVAVAAAVNLIVSAYLMRKSRLTSSSALEATAADLRTDAFVSIAVLVALVIVKLTGVHWLDPVVGLAIGVAISSTGVRILNGAARRLADETLPAAELERLQEVARSFLGAEVVGYHDLRARHVGNTHQVDLHLQFADGTSLRRAHEISHELQDAMMAVLPNTTVLVHLEPEERVRPDRFPQPTATPQPDASASAAPDAPASAPPDAPASAPPVEHEPAPRR